MAIYRTTRKGPIHDLPGYTKDKQMALPAPYSRTLEISRHFTGLTALQVAELLEALYNEMCDNFEVTLQPYAEMMIYSGTQQYSILNLN